MDRNRAPHPLHEPLPGTTLTSPEDRVHAPQSLHDNNENAEHLTEITNAAVARSVRVESWAIWAAIIAALTGAGVGWLLFRGELTALSGNWSIGTVAAWATGITAGAATLTGLYVVTSASAAASAQGRTLRWMRQRHWVWWILDLAGLVILHAATAMLAVLSMFRLFQQAFQGLRVDEIAATAMLSIACAGAGYFGFNSAVRASTRSLSTLLALFMAAGMLASMLLAENPYWWHAFFSELGTGQAGVLSFWTFNTTLVICGLVLVTLANFITQDLYAWAQRRADQGKLRPRVGVLRIGLVVIGLCLVGVSFVPINVNDPVHTGFVQILAGMFCLMLFTLPLWLPGMPAALYVLSYLMLAVGVLAVALWEPLGYYNLTALELAFAGIIFAWLVVLIRTVDAVIRVPRHET